MTDKSQRTVYLEEDLDDWIEGLREESGYSFSEQVAELLKLARSTYEESSPEEQRRIVHRAYLERKIARLEDELEQNPPPEES